MPEHSREQVIYHLSAFANGQFDTGVSDVFAVVERRQFDCVPATEEANTYPSKASLPYMKRWQLERGIFTVFTDEEPID